MTVLEAHGRFAGWTADRRAALPFDCTMNLPGGTADTWPAAAVAACVCTGWLPTAGTDEDLADGLRQFQRLLGGGIVSESQWREETAGVLTTLADWAERQGELTGIDPAAWN